MLAAFSVSLLIRQLEMLNIFMGFEQSNRYVISVSRLFTAYFFRYPLSFAVKLARLESHLDILLKNRGVSFRCSQDRCSGRIGHSVHWSWTLKVHPSFGCVPRAQYYDISVQIPHCYQIRRPFSWINSRMFVQRPMDYLARTPEGQLVLDTFAEVQQEWHLWKRRYNLFLRYVCS